MTGPLLLFALICAFCFALTVFLRVRFEYVFPISLMLSVMIVFFFGVFNYLKTGFYVLLVLTALLFTSAIIYAPIKKSFRITLRRFFSPGFFVFVFLFVFLAYGNYGRRLASWDEFSHWGTVVNQMTVFDVFGTNPVTVVSHRSYPPGMAVFQYILQKFDLLVNPDANFSEWQLFFSYQLFSYSLFFPFIAKLNYKKLYSYVILAALFMVPRIIFDGIIDAIYIDAFLGLAAGAGLAAVFCAEEKNTAYRLYTILIISMLVLAKAAGMLFAAFTALAYIISEISGAKHASEKPPIFCIISAAAAVLLPKLLWDMNMTLNGVGRQKMSFDIKSFINILLRREESLRWDVMRNFYNALTSGSNVSVLGTKLIYPVLFAALACILLVLCIEYKKAFPEKEKLFKSLYWIVIIQTAAYIIGTCFVYMYSFSPESGMRLPSFDRYLSIAFGTMIIMAALLFINLMAYSRKSKSLLAAIFLCIVLIFSDVDTFRDFLSRYSARSTADFRVIYDTLSSEIKSLADKDSTVAVISQGTDGFDYFVFKYSFLPQSADGRRIKVFDKFSALKNGGDSKDLAAEEWQILLKEECDYVILFKTDDYFKRTYKAVFEDPSSISDGAVFAVDKDNGQLLPA